jgi:hypothetical protein
MELIQKNNAGRQFFDVTSLPLFCFDIFVCKINNAEEGRKAEGYGKFKFSVFDYIRQVRDFT